MRAALALTLFALAATSACAQIRSAAPAAEQPPVLQLGSDVRPGRYELALEIDPRQEGFRGTASIHVELAHERRSFWLHGQDLHVTSAEIEAAGQRGPARWEQVNDEGLARLTAEKTVPAGPAVLHLAWEAKFNPKLVGLYVSKAGGLAYASTQFETLDARRAFPCFDDPQFKTPFDVSLTVPAADVAASNTFPVEESPAGEGKKKLRFERTRPLPTYLVAFAVGPFDVVEGSPLPPNEIRKRPLRTRGLAPKGRGPELAHALAASAALIPIFERYFGLEYPYSKLDHIAVPDFEHGAMENAGAIVYRETALLYREGVGGEERRNGTAGTIAHEEAHQWFGDLVTLPWWTDAWLNEGFATWMGGKAMRSFRPQDRGDLAAVAQMNGVMGADELTTSRAIRQPLNRLADVWNQFDYITYTKGASVLRMFERWASPEKFQQGVHGYLAEHADGTGSTDSLLAHLDRASAGKSIGGPFRTFLDQPGVPLVAARLECKEGAARLHLRQSRFLPLGSSGDREGQLWQIPICARWGVGGETQQGCTLLSSREGSLDLGAACPAWVMPNADGAGYYRWSLEPEALRKLAQVGYASLSPHERLSFAHAILAAPRAGAIEEAEALQQLAPFVADPSDEVAGTPLSLLSFAILELAGPTQAEARRHAIGLYRPVAERLGWTPAKDEPLPRTRLRVAVLEFLALVADDPATRREAVARGRAYLAGGALHPEAVAPDLAWLSLAVALQEDDGPLFAEALTLVPTLEDLGLRRRLLDALGAARDPKRVDQALAFGLDPRLRKSERLTSLQAAFGEPRSRAQAWAWLQANLDKVAPLVPASTLAGMPWTAGSFCDEQRRAEAAAFFKPRLATTPGLERNLAQAEEHIHLCATRRQAHAPGVQAFFRKAAGSN